MKLTSAPIGIAALYLGIAVITFGHSAAHAKCRADALPGDCEMQANAGAIMAAMLWPLYWSWELQS